jgi:hypothetical protein
MPVELANTGSDYLLKIPDLGITDSINMDNIVITPFEGGYKLTRAGSIDFIIPEITIPPTPPLFPDGGTFYNVPVRVTLGSSQVVDFVLTLNITATATITLSPIPIPVNIPMLINFEGMLFAPPIITTTTLPNGTVNKEYSAILEADGIKPMTWNIFGGALPTGLQLDEHTGEIAGTPTEAGFFEFDVMATNASGNEAVRMHITIEEQDTTGIATPTMPLVKVFPNPTTGDLTITNYELQITDIEVFDVSGRKQKAEGRKQNEERGLVIDISHLPVGIYLLKIHTNKGTQTQRIIKN